MKNSPRILFFVFKILYLIQLHHMKRGKKIIFVRNIFLFVCKISIFWNFHSCLHSKLFQLKNSIFRILENWRWKFSFLSSSISIRYSSEFQNKSVGYGGGDTILGTSTNSEGPFLDQGPWITSKYHWLEVLVHLLTLYE